ncbi:MAG: phosphotransferase [Anaerolineae bacterium]|nr:phosphotransferase [Anaerolineae bacterium]
MPSELLPDFVATVNRIFGDAGRAWLPQLPGILAACHAKWQLVAGTPCPAMRINYIEFTETPTGEPVVLKVGVPHEELFTEMAALALYNGHGAVRLLDADRDLGAMLMARVQPGTMLWQWGTDDEQTRVAATLMAGLPVAPPTTHHLPTFARWVERAFRLTRTLWDPEELMPRALVDRAEAAFEAMLADDPDPVVLHGDLHHENILWDAESGWLAIDPKGVIGPRALEVGRFIRNQLPPHLPRGRREALVRKRVAILSRELGLPREKVVAGALVDCVLSHCWGFEDESLGPDWHLGIDLGNFLWRMLDA